ncbi:MAG: glycosyl hydrolase family 28 protein [Catalinimonas sp.]
MKKPLPWSPLCALLIGATLAACSTAPAPTDALAADGDTLTAFVYGRIEAIAAALPAVEARGDTIDLIDFAGRQPDFEGTFDFKPAYDRALAEVTRRGGGVIYLRHTAGRSAWIKETQRYRFAGPMNLADNLTILFDPGVMLMFDTARANYLGPDGRGVLTRYEGTTIYGYSPLIRGYRVENVALRALEGYGAPPVIWGQGEVWQRWASTTDAQRKAAGRTPDYIRLREDNNRKTPLAERRYDDLIARPDMVQFFMCRNVVMEGLTLRESPFWVVHTLFSENLLFRGLTYDAHVVNNDGIDVESSRNVLIEDVMFNNHDDNVVIKAGRDQEGMFGIDVTGSELEGVESPYIKDNLLMGRTENVGVRNCVFHGHHAVAIGSEMSGGVRGIYVANCFSPQYVYMGLYLKGSRKRGGEVSDVYMVDCQFNKLRADLVAVIPNYDGDTSSAYPSAFHDVYVHNVTAREAQNGVRALGWADRPIENVMISDVKIDRVRDAPYAVEQSRNVRFERVSIGGKTLTEQFDRLDADYVPPTTK